MCYLRSEEQNNFSKKVTSSGDWTWDLGAPIDFWTYIHDLAKINRAWLSLSLSLTSNVKLAQSGSYESVHTKGPRVLGSQVQSPLRYLSCLNYFLSLHKQYKNNNIANFVYYGKTRLLLRTTLICETKSVMDQDIRKKLVSVKNR